MCRQVLDNWVLSTLPNFGLNKLKFFLIWRQKHCKIRRRIIFIEALDRKFSSSYILELPYLKNYANHLIHMFVIHMESNTAKELVPIQPQQFVSETVASLST